MSLCHECYYISDTWSRWYIYSPYIKHCNCNYAVQTRTFKQRKSTIRTKFSIDWCSQILHKTIWYCVNKNHEWILNNEVGRWNTLLLLYKLRWVFIQCRMIVTRLYCLKFWNQKALKRGAVFATVKSFT